MARKKKQDADGEPNPREVIGGNGGMDHSKLKEYVDRYVGVEQTFQEAKAERDDTVKDLKAEIKSNTAETGVEVGEVLRLAKIRLQEAAQRAELAAFNDSMSLYDVIFGRNTDDEDPLA